MAISIKAASENLKTNAYDKQTLNLYFALMAIGGFLYGLGAAKNSVNIGLIFIFMCLYAVVMLFYSGFYCLSAHRRYINCENVLPDIKTEYKTIFMSALKCIGGAIILSIVFGVISGIISVTLLKILPILAVLAYIALFVFMIFIITALNACFLGSLRFNEWFNFTKAIEIIKKHFKTICLYYWKSFIVGFICSIAAVIIICLVSVIIGIVLHSNMTLLNITASVFGGIIGTLASSVVGLFGIDLAGQFLQELDK